MYVVSMFDSIIVDTIIIFVKCIHTHTPHTHHTYHMHSHTHTHTHTPHTHTHHTHEHTQVLTRDFLPCKPDPAPLLHICRQWKVPSSAVVMVGDGVNDMQSGRSAGAGVVTHYTGLYKTITIH